MVIAITPSGRLTVRPPGAKFYAEGTDLVDRTGRFHGRVARVYGPVSRPYLSVRPRRPLGPAEAAALIGRDLTAEGG